jgi:hypothetical protein
MSGTLAPLLASASHTLGGQPSADNVRIITEAGTQPTRHYHTVAHFEALARAWEATPPLPALHEHVDAAHMPVLQALITRAGAHHDLVYLNADKHRLPASLSAWLAPFVTLNDAGEVIATADTLPSHATPSQHKVFAWAQIVFAKKSTHKHGTNEYLSAVYAALQGLEEGIPDAYLLSEMLMIAGTIPFQPANYFDVLQQRFTLALATLHDDAPLSTALQNDILRAGVHLANADVIGFGNAQPSAFQADSKLLLQEGTAQTTLAARKTSSAQLMRSLHQALEHPTPHSAVIFHQHHGFPSQATLDALHRNALIQLNTAIAFFEDAP